VRRRGPAAAGRGRGRDGGGAVGTPPGQREVIRPNERPRRTRRAGRRLSREGSPRPPGGGAVADGRHGRPKRRRAAHSMVLCGEGARVSQARLRYSELPVAWLGSRWCRTRAIALLAILLEGS